MSFILSSDSCCDTLKSTLKQENIFYLSMAYIIEDTEYRDNFDSSEEYRVFYDSLRNGLMPKTTQLNAYETAEYFEKLLKENDGDIIHFSLSSGLSNTATNAEAAAKEMMRKYPDRKVYVIDTKSATQGQMYLVDRAKEMREQGKSALETYEAIIEITDRLHHFIVVKDLHHLKRGGRVSSAAAVVGSILKIRPILVINHEGQLVVIDKEKGVTKALNHLVKAIKKYKKEATNRAYIAHSDDIENAEDLKKMLFAEGITDVNIGYIGPVIGTHTGPGTIGLVFEGTKRLHVVNKEK